MIDRNFCSCCEVHDGNYCPMEMMVIELRSIIARKDDALRAVGNAVGGPTMTYLPGVEVREWRERAGKISRLVSDALRIGEGGGK